MIILRTANSSAFVDGQKIPAQSIQMIDNYDTKRVQQQQEEKK
jgi:hypothetical protein